MSPCSMANLMHIRKLKEELVLARAERDQALNEKIILEEKSRQVLGIKQELAAVQVKFNEFEEQLKGYANLYISKEDLHKWCVAFIYRMMSTGGMAAAIEEVNLIATKCGAHRVALAGLKRLRDDRPIKAKWFKQLLIPEPKKTMHEAMVKGPSEEESILDVPDEYTGIELEDADDEAIDEDVADIGHSEVQKKAEETSQSMDMPLDRDADGWSVHRVHLMVLSEEQAKEFPPYSMISGIMRGRADIHSVKTVKKLEVDLLDMMRTHNRENTQLRQGQKIAVSQWFLEKHHVLARVQHMISIRTRSFIAAMEMLKERVQEVELLLGYINDLQNLLLDHQIDFPIFEKPEAVADPRTRSSREELLMKVHAQDEEIVDLKDKLNQCVNLLSQHGFKGLFVLLLIILSGKSCNSVEEYVYFLRPRTVV
ncbi:OLC1v1008902C1 [Oldenlandia corymbosa var. corymbosa]|uniref:OLC1v1008902C1 n=1 Tax=Oldenlandia corymbosa var. corymbosa TaxID=529605 RepID=A0AAV1DMQ0_OLDCO|nr:OLC1v1008902C1 [Oldenlandia corymbosa var. corymbosa]